ncbi:hypothetical protein HYV74_02325 [Candidatus Uhrbacteria bacterium]|nr:hypothetical protein [Candidatus Uhrbacteria bacterium]
MNQPAAVLSVRPGILERMKTEIVPLDDLIAAQDEINRAAREHADRFRAEREEGYAALDELREIRKQFAEVLDGSKRNDARKAIVSQIELRKQKIAERLGERSMQRFDAFDRVAAIAETGEHFGHLRQLLGRAQAEGFFEAIDAGRAAKERARGRGFMIFSAGRDIQVFPKDFEHDRLVRTLTWRALDLRKVALERAKSDRPRHYQLLLSGEIPPGKEGAEKLLGVLSGERPLKRALYVGAVLVDCGVRDPKSQKMFQYNGLVGLVFFPQDGKTYIGITGAIGSIERVLPLKAAPISMAPNGTTPWARAVLRHLYIIAKAMTLTDEEAKAENVKLRAAGKTEGLWLEKAEERQYAWDELRGDLWRQRHAEWIAALPKKGSGKIEPLPQATPEIERKFTAADAGRLVEAAFKGK